MDVYSKPLKIEHTLLATIFFMKPRNKKEKPGRVLSVSYDKRFPLVKDFKINYIYTVNFLEKENHAGNHYHIKKNELFVPLLGEFSVLLEDPKTKKKETIQIRANEYPIIHVKAGTAHKVVSKSNQAILLVLATSANIDGDEFNYDVN